MRRKQNIYSWIAIIAITIAIILVLILIFTFEPQWDQPVKISHSLDPKVVKENEPAKLIFTITNVNETNHEVQFIFATETKIEIYAGTDELLPNNAYNFTIGAYERDQVREFTILGSLEENISSATYQIQLQVSIDEQIVPELTRNIYLSIIE
jgi:hypothetical protein